MKKAQIAIFAAVALLIVAIVILLLYVQGIILPLSEEESKAILSSQVEPLRSFTSNCIEEATADALNFLGEHAGYADFAEDGLKSIDFAGEKVVVVVRTENGFVNRLPSKTAFEEQFNSYINNGASSQLDNCLNDFAGFKEQGFSVSPGKREIRGEISSGSFDVNVDWPILLRKGRARLQAEAQDIKIIIKVETALRVANDIVNKEAAGITFEGLEQDKYITENSLTFKGVSLDSQNYPTADQKIFLITTKISDPREKEFRFYFAVDRTIPI